MPESALRERWFLRVNSGRRVRVQVHAGIHRSYVPRRSRGVREFAVHERWSLRRSTEQDVRLPLRPRVRRDAVRTEGSKMCQVSLPSHSSLVLRTRARLPVRVRARCVGLLVVYVAVRSTHYHCTVFLLTDVMVNLKLTLKECFTEL